MGDLRCRSGSRGRAWWGPANADVRPGGETVRTPKRRSSYLSAQDTSPSRVLFFLDRRGGRSRGASPKSSMAAADLTAIVGGVSASTGCGDCRSGSVQYGYSGDDGQGGIAVLADAGTLWQRGTRQNWKSPASPCPDLGTRDVSHGPRRCCSAPWRSVPSEFLHASGATAGRDHSCFGYLAFLALETHFPLVLAPLVS